MRGLRSRFLLLALFCLAVAAPAHAEKRVALVIGNSAYKSINALDNPKNDAALIAETLRGLGFTLVGGGAQLDLDKPAIDRAVQRFGKELVGADVGLFYYAGHGLQVRGANFLVPVDANPIAETDVDFQMLDANLVLRQMENAGTKLNLVILDACRNNPFGGRSLRSVDRGLAIMQAPEGTLISFATQPGNVARDGADGDSPFTKALAQTMRKPGLDVFRTFNEVGLAVSKETAGMQQPWVSLSPIKGDFYFTAGGSTGTAEASLETSAAQAWGATQNTTSVAVLEDFIRQFGGTAYGSMARARLEELKKLQVAAVSPTDRLGPTAVKPSPSNHSEGATPPFNNLTPSSDSRSNKARDDDVLASLAPPSSMVENDVLKSVSVSTALHEITTTQDVATLGKSDVKDDERDWTGKVQDIINKFKEKQDKSVSTAGDVTEHAIEQSLDAALSKTKLNTFQSFLGENWTADRLRVKVLERVLADLDSLFNGNSRGYAPMQQLDTLIQHAAEVTYRRIFEISELLAANGSEAIFVQRLYQDQGARVDDKLREDIDGMLGSAAGTALGKYEVAFRGNEIGYALRYRAERIVFDCLSENVTKISSSETGIATPGEIWQRIVDTAKTECISWLDHQFGADTRAISTQKPMPLRVVWSADGPKDDPSMYGQTTSELQ